jgi:hypothetical protein
MGKFSKIALLAGAGALVLLAWFVVRAVTARVSPTTDYATEINQRVIAQIATGEGVPPTPNQWDRVAALGRGLADAEAAILRVFPMAPEGFGDGRWPQDSFDRSVFGMGEANRERLREVALLPEVRAVFEGSAMLPQARGYRELPKGVALVELLFPELGPSRQLARAMGQQMQLAALDERWELAAEWYERCLGLGRIGMSQPTLIDRLVGGAIVGHANERLKEVLAHTSPHDAALKSFDAALVRQLGIDEIGNWRRVPAAEFTIRNERAFLMDTVQWCFTDDGGGDGRLVPSQLERFSSSAGTVAGGAGRTLANLTGSFLAGREDTVAVLEEYFASSIARSKQTARERLASEDPIANIHGLSRRYVFVPTLLPPVGAAINASDQMQLEVIGVRLVIALERHRVRTGGYPEALRDLVPLEIAFVPADPFAAIGLQYRKVGASYVLYSAGLDNTDDNAKEPEKVKERVFPLQRVKEGKGLDFVIGPPGKVTEEK